MSPKKKHVLQSFHWLHYICLELWSSSFPTTTKRATSPNGQTTCNLLFSGPRLCSSHDNKAAKVSSFNSARAWFTAAATWAHLWRRCLRPRPGKRPTRCSPTPPWCWAAALRCGKRWAGGTPTHHLDKTEEIEWKRTPLTVPSPSVSHFVFRLKPQKHHNLPLTQEESISLGFKTLCGFATAAYT